MSATATTFIACDLTLDQGIGIRQLIHFERAFQALACLPTEDATSVQFRIAARSARIGEE
jgi:hypothetical protein